MKTESILVPWDFSEHAEAALRYALQNYPGSRLHLVCVLEYPNPYAYGPAWTGDEAEQAKQRCNEDFEQAVGSSLAERLDFLSIFGEPAEEILRVAESEDVDLILMPTHGRTGLSRLLMGSVAQKVIAQSTCPIVLLPGRWVENNMPHPVDAVRAS